ncbi:MAG: DUF4382 domain-containing protein [Candidatus Mcinerneyibacterium aminivorans]|jgi:hypothetical protein|uniref:DUF4382 domain-containing protein n=1 Tax=Candidatus Mcinerneyibacterium aminivorans TaxID=2703815 RepID=A0A5D0MME3_9BACT|nr:MAG: DUF4382 domain-containing protein [Candidatus Mcinerneyibacterium aminivorans]
MKKILFTVFIAVILFWGCSNSTGPTGSGDLEMLLTDGPIDSTEVSEVMVKFKEIKVNKTGDLTDFKTFKEYGENEGIFNLMDLQDGLTSELGTKQMDAGVYSHIRIIFDDTYDHHITVNGSYEPLELTYSTEEGNFTTGHLELAGSFRIEEGIKTSLILDFDVRKSVVDQETGYKLHPAIRLVTEDITGAADIQLSNIPAEVDHVISYLYNDGTFDETTEIGNDFTNSVISDDPNDSNLIEFDYIEEGTYTLVIATFDADGNIIDVYTKSIEIVNGETAQESFDFSA